MSFFQKKGSIEETCDCCGRLERESLEEGDPVIVRKTGELGWVHMRSLFGKNNYRVIIPGEPRANNRYCRARYDYYEREKLDYVGPVR